MRRTSAFMAIFFVLFLISISLFFDPRFLIMFFACNLLVFYLLVKEPYWKIGALILTGIFIWNNLFVLNRALFGFFIHYGDIFSFAMSIFGLLISYVAHRMKSFEAKEPINLPDRRILIVTLENRVVHFEDCLLSKKLSDKEKIIIGSIRYAKSKNYKPCSKCKPY